MGAYTWTFVRVDKLSKEQVEKVVTEAKQSASLTTYGEYSKLPFKEALEEWLKFHEEERDYFIEECGVSPEKLTKEFLTRKLKTEMKAYRAKMRLYDKVLTGEMTLEEMLHKTHQLNGFCNDFYIIKRQGHYYVNIRYENFRNYEYCDEEFHTVDALIDHCKSLTYSRE